MIPVAEIFGPTIQGEGPNTGIKTLFVRVAGCDFKCSWCDSKFAWKIDKDTKRYEPEELAKELVQRCRDTYTSHVILTGGNPCLYSFGEVIDILHNNKITVDVEAQGSKFPEWLYKVDQLVISPKAPSSGQKDVYDNVLKFLSNEEKVPVGYNVAIKIPVFNEEDFKFAERYYELVQLVQQVIWNTNVNAKMYLSVGNTNTSESGDISSRVLNDYKHLIERVMESKMKRVFVMPQLHTLVWGNKQGV